MRRILLLLAIIFILIGCSSQEEKAIADAEAALQSGDFETALKSYNLALTENANNPEVKEQIDLLNDYVTLQENMSNSEWADAHSLANNMLENDRMMPSLEEEVKTLLATIEGEIEKEEQTEEELQEIKELISKDDVEKARTRLSDLKDKLTTDAYDTEIKDLQNRLTAAEERIADAEQQEREQESQAEKDRVKEEAIQSGVEKARQQTAVTTPKLPEKETSSLKYEYMAKAEDLHNKIIGKAHELYEHDIEPGFTGQYYGDWDNLLNEVWGVLKDTLPANEFETLKAEQNDWIQMKEQNFADMPDGTAAERGTGMDYLTAETRDRLFYLIENYLN